MTSPSYRIAGRMSPDDLTVVAADSQFARAIRRAFELARPRNIIETGTYRGQGTTRAIATAIRDLRLTDAVFHSIEVNARHYARATENLLREGLLEHVRLHHGLSVPRELLPTLDQIDESLVRTVQADRLVVDHEEHERAALYHRETDYAGVPDDLLGSILAGFEYQADFVLLDSGGHMGFVEFSYLIERVKSECVIALDDVNHVKHHRSFATVRSDRRFRLIESGDEKFGFCIARFVPDGAAESLGKVA
jgi:hypothetical protein